MTCCPCLQSLLNPRQSLWEFSSRWKPSNPSRVFTDLLTNSPKRSPRFSPGFEGTENMFYFLNDIPICPLLIKNVGKQKKTTKKTGINKRAGFAHKVLERLTDLDLLSVFLQHPVKNFLFKLNLSKFSNCIAMTWFWCKEITNHFHVL